MKLSQTGKDKFLGFKFVCPQNYPNVAPFAFLDEVEDPEVVEMVDYLDAGNRIMF